MPTTAEAVRAAFLAAAEEVEGLEWARDYEPERLPKGPGLTMLLTKTDPTVVETGIAEDVEWEWRVNVYFPLADYRVAQRALEEVVPRVLRITRVDPRLGDACEWARLRDEGDEPVFAHEEGWLLKSLVLNVRSEET